jgi:hypothetical protein
MEASAWSRYPQRHPPAICDPIAHVDNDEVTLRDLREDTAEKKQDYKKPVLHQNCAIKDGLRYF